MAIDSRSRGGVGGGSVTSHSISFSNGIERFVGRASNTGNGSGITATEVKDVDIDFDEIVEPEKYANAVGRIEPSTGATICIIFTSILSGVLDVVESVVDAGGYVIAECVSLVDAEKGRAIREAVAVDAVGELNKMFYEGTEWGREINSHSAIKYDSDTAQGIRKTTEQITKYAAETALTVASGGAAAAAFGAAAAIGTAAERTYQTKGVDNITFADNLRIWASGVGGAIEGYSVGKMGAKIIKSFSSLTPTILSNTVKGLPAKVVGFVKNGWTGLMHFDWSAAVTGAKKTLFCFGTWGKALGSQAVSVTNAVADWIETGEFKLQDWLKILKSTGKTVLFQTAMAFGASGITSGYDEFQRAETNRKLDAMTEEERSQAWEDYFKRRYGEENVTHDSGIGIAGHNGSYVDPDAAAVNAMLIHNYEMKEIAQGIVAGTNPDGIKVVLTMSSEDRFKVLSNMSPKEIAIAVETLSPEEYKTIMDTLPSEKKLEVIFAQGELAAQGKYDAFFMNFREHSVEHSANVRDYAVDLARRMGIDINVTEVEFGAQYHDLGMKGGVYRDVDGICRPIDSLGQTEVTFDELEKYIKKSLMNNKNATAAELDKFMEDHYGIKDWSKNRSMALVPAEVQQGAYSKRVMDYITDNLGMSPKELMAQYGVEDWNGDMSQVPQEIKDAAYRYTVANLCRANHPLNSAIIILKEGMGSVEERNIVALLAMSHSKSTSGIKDLGSREQWNAAIDRLGSALRDDGMSPQEVQNITDSLRATLDENFDDIAREALCIRDGDAMAPLALVNGDTVMQNGTHTHVEYTGRAQLDGYGDTPTPVDGMTDEELIKARKAAQAAETAGIQDTVYGADDPLNERPIGEITNGFSKKTHAGELNVAFDSDYDGRDYIASATVQDPTKAPYATIDAIWERAGEIATYGNCRERAFEIHLPKDMEGTPLAEWYRIEITRKAAEAAAEAVGQAKDFYSFDIKIVFDQ